MFHAPKDIYGPNLFRMFVDELGGVKSVSKFLEATERTVWRWLETERIPRSAVLALYWESRYGRSQIFTEQVNEIRLLYRRNCLLQEQYTRAKDIVAGVLKFQGGAANSFVWDELPAITALPSQMLTVSLSDSHAESAEQHENKPSKRATSAMASFEALRKAKAG
jgi:hypothetical protein